MTWGDVALICTIEITFFWFIFEEYLDISNDETIREISERIDKLHK